MPPKKDIRAGLQVYLRARVLIVTVLGFAAGLPLALTTATLAVWMTEAGLDIKTIGLFSLIGVPYTLKFLWASAFDAWRLPLICTLMGRRRGWLITLQLALVIAIMVLGAMKPAQAPFLTALTALNIAVLSASQDIVIDAFRIESLQQDEQAAGMAGYVAAYRVALLVSSAGVIALSAFFETQGLSLAQSWTYAYFAAAALMLPGIAATLLAREDRAGEIPNAPMGSASPLAAFLQTAVSALKDFLTQPAALLILAFVILFKLCDALAGVLTAPFVIATGYEKTAYAGIVKGIGFAAALIGGFAGGVIAHRVSVAASLWFAGVAQMFSNLAFSALALIGVNNTALALAVLVENLTGGIGTVIFVAYISSLCKTPLHTATQFALLSALASVGRTTLSAPAGYIADAAGWPWFFTLTAIAALPGLALLWWLQRIGHFKASGAP